ncbi:MAG TPA: ABC transporter permease [Burkholderiaceae bacterium]|nr:ABC transporter permease [Burkholderiaceae bacterium]
MSQTLLEALTLLAQLEHRVLAIVLLSLAVSSTAVAIGTLIGLPLGALVAVGRWPGRNAAVVALNSMMGLPSVVVGVIVYLSLSRSGPLGPLGLLFTPTAMIIAQTLLTAPLIAALTRQIVEDAWRGYAVELQSMRYTRMQTVALLLYDCRFSLLVAVLAGLGRAMAEVGAVMIVGGNIEGYTRVMTTTIALETSKGDLALAIALGTVLIAVVLVLNAAAHLLNRWAMHRYG